MCVEKVENENGAEEVECKVPTWTRQSITTTPTYIRHKRWFPHTGLDPLPVQALEEVVQLHLSCPVPGAFATEPVLRTLLQ